MGERASVAALQQVVVWASPPTPQAAAGMHIGRSRGEQLGQKLSRSRAGTAWCSGSTVMRCEARDDNVREQQDGAGFVRGGSSHASREPGRGRSA